ncbi:MAG: hypothetical protein EA390_03900 [Balneolaceae bacterium]|nr:MAG: hypothetical protein EA390_03900 [Balneolaceae bacterium]
MKVKLLGSFLIIMSSMLYLMACDNNVSPGLEDSFELFTGLELLPEAENTTLRINKGSDVQNDAYFKVNISDVLPNEFIKNVSADAWCLEWNKPLRSNDDIHQGVRAFATASNDKWKPLNYLFSIQNDLKAQYPEKGTLTYREMQAVVWTLAGYMGIAPEFNVDKLSDSELPSRLRENGKANFSREMVKVISELVLKNYSSSTISLSGFALETEEGQQNVFIIPPSGITTNEVTNVTPTTAVSGGVIEDSGDSPITQKGVCWSTSANPTTADSCTNDGSGPDDFSSNISGLNQSTMYYVRAYAINEAGTAYGNQRTFTTGLAGEVDKELNVCGEWSASQSGGFGVTVDTWDISEIPVGSSFDIRFDALNQPDRYVVEYPIGNEVYDSGWRGLEWFYNDPIRFPEFQPEGVVGPGQGQEDNIFEKDAQNTFRVVVTGPQQGTIWFYDIRCRIPD